MTIEIIGTTVNITGNKVIGFALNNLVDHFEATVDTSADWFYQLKIYMIKVDKYNIINLDRNGNVLSVDLTRPMFIVLGLSKAFLTASFVISLKTTLFFCVSSISNSCAKCQEIASPSLSGSVARYTLSALETCAFNSLAALNDNSLAMIERVVPEIITTDILFIYYD